MVLTYLPVHLGGRFSRKAMSPSRASSVARQPARRSRRSGSAPRCRDRPARRRRRGRDGGDGALGRDSIGDCRTSKSSSSGATARPTRPTRRRLVGVSRSPRSIISSSRRRGTTRGARHDHHRKEPYVDLRRSERRLRGSDGKVLAATSPRPPPMACPLTRATTGVSLSSANEQVCIVALRGQTLGERRQRSSRKVATRTKGSPLAR